MTTSIAPASDTVFIGGVGRLDSSFALPSLSPVQHAHRPLSAGDRGVQFGQTLVGSMIGAAVGGLLGGVVLAGADQDRRRPYADDENRPEALAFLLFVGGPPTGAVLYSTLPRDHTGAYVMAVLGEIAIGGAGALLGTALGGDSDRDRVIGGLTLGGAGAIIGAAGGAALAAPNRSTGALRYEDGSWSTQWPTVQVGIHRNPQPGLHGTVSLVSVKL